MKHPRFRLTGDVLLLVVVIAALVVAAGLLHQVASQARTISSHAHNIAADTREIDGDTAAIGGLDRTNSLAASILRSVGPLNRQLTTTTNSARTVDADVRAVNDIADGIRGTAGSIGHTAGSINANAAAILTEARGIEDSTAAIRDIAGGINTLAASILQVSGNINDDVQQINRNLDATIELARQIHANTARLVAAGVITRSQAACIDEEVHLLTPAHNGGAACGHDKEAADER